MNTYNLIKTGLFFHLAGIVTMVGTTIAGISAHLRFQKLLIKEKDRALVALNTTDRYPALQTVGAVLVLIGGVI